MLLGQDGQTSLTVNTILPRISPRAIGYEILR
jgi:hypothetical protein